MVGSFSLPKEIQPETFTYFDKPEIESSIPDRFEKMVALYPNNLALKHGEEKLTYQELNSVSNQLAHHFLEEMEANPKPVAFLLEHGIPQIYTILGILKSGSAYVALDPAFPAARLAYIFEDSTASQLVTNTKNIDLARDLCQNNQQIINLDEMEDYLPVENPGLEIPPDSMATILYTSGSTGQPKGCIRPHRNILHGIMGDTNRLFLNPQDRFGLFLSASYAAFEVPTYGALLNGAGLFPFDIKKDGLLKLGEWLKNDNITILVTVPSAFRNIVAALPELDTYSSLRILFMGGESVLNEDVELYKKYLPHTAHMTVALAGSEFQRICAIVISKSTNLPSNVVPVGYELEDKKILLLNKDGFPVEHGEVGEISVQSRYLTPGYWHKPDLTALSFSDVPNQPGVRQYRTGDLGRMQSDGCLEHLGRLDYQVKIRGHRVELNEITANLLSISEVVDATVVANPDTAGNYQLVAYIVPADLPALNIKNIRKTLSGRLPSYMLPSRIIVLDELPKTPTGKVDVQSLPEDGHSLDTPEDAIPWTVTPIEEKLVEIWESLVDHPVSIHDDFFEIGGHSLLALRLVAKIEETFGTSIPFPAFIQNRTIEKLTALLQDTQALDSWSHMVALQPKGKKPPFYLVPPSAVTAVIFNDLVKYWDPDRPLLVMEYKGMDGETDPHNSITEMARYNLETIRTLQPNGPYYLGGMCFGGLVAYEMAHQLLADGEQVAFLGILDSTHAPNLTRPFMYPVFRLTRFINQKILKQRFPIGMAPLRRAMKKFSNEDELGRRVYRVFTAHNDARVNYLTSPYPGRITLFNTPGRKGEFSGNQWKRVVGGKLDTVIVSGVHAGARVDAKEGEIPFVNDPNAEVLARNLLESLDRTLH